MAKTQYILDNNASNGTSNLSYLLSSEDEAAIRTLTPRLIEKCFGPGDETLYEPTRGYEDPEWYWQSSNGSVWGIAWRWGSARLRGRGGKQSNQDGPFWIHPREEEAAEFVKFLCGEVQNG